MIKESDILGKTHYGLHIYAHILQHYYPDETVIKLSGKQCLPAKNPFNANRQTLLLNNVDWVFLFSDAELPGFKGNPFDFAGLHYKLSGQELLERINKELNLNIGKEPECYFNNDLDVSHQLKPAKPKVNMPKFSFFKAPVSNIIPAKEITLLQAFRLIKSERYRDTTNRLRSISSKEEARRFKASHFDYATFSGTFSKRNDKALLNHSGLLTIDFDHIPNLQELKNQLLQDEYFETELLFVSPSGDGLKWIIPIDITEGTHQNFFKAIAAYIKEVYQQEVDKSGKDISRACFLPHDPNAFINPKYLK
jgi:hypothetical protein